VTGHISPPRKEKSKSLINLFYKLPPKPQDNNFY
jgi:hypothetical protein